MPRLVTSSTPGAVGRLEAEEALIERATLTRLVCQLLRDEARNNVRAVFALFLLLRWVSEYLGKKAFIVNEGLDSMPVPLGCEALMEEILDSTPVCCRFQMSTWADSLSDFEEDLAKVNDLLAEYWATHPHPSHPNRSKGS